MTDQEKIHDVIGVGFGPSNLALAIALKERNAALDAIFLEAKDSFAWHPDMLLDNSDMQVSFIKDLVTLRNPASPYSFLSYLHAKGRMERFVNRKTFFPSRHEFNDYFTWAAAHHQDYCHYNQSVVRVAPVQGPNGAVELLDVVSEDPAGVQTRRRTRDLVLAVGGRPNVPEVFSELRGHPAVVHSSAYLSTVKPRLAASGRPLKVAVIGSGQSGAEIFWDLANDVARPEVDFIFRSHALKPSDDSPFVNEIFDAGFTSYVFNQPPQRRAAVLAEYANTNYSVVDGDLIEQIYGLFYEQDVVGGNSHALLRSTRVVAAESGPAPETGQHPQVELLLAPVEGGEELRCRYDLVILATGFRRRLGETLLAGLEEFLTGVETDRGYRIGTTAGFGPRIFLQGYSENTHGLSDTLLSVLPVRADEIASGLMSPRDKDRQLLTAAE
ncbi:lysine N(6)-hydroxylase/L-ornithine N(5)-oxygenase family protein [Phaeobacter sp. B1627]|uniref:lysine N(6)-hydroxylase/L-ornithine N(5)-oxygenase family protein n=1 Tax=Phaeobacter sp. B1627 TaxID=2583809 RepID=UPI00111A757C|nr:lysine N(6)-hydroxylase/L-ornithine N(5)-oxygenase family protein [Phaeobacter sp. B1627]TNJ42750.1 lysine N(6)-hydroxylase/L-ornithine N(5)-oxygenase family protein [Phaeobacter sp. B1627]